MANGISRRTAVKRILCCVAAAACPAAAARPVHAAFRSKNRCGELSFYDVRSDETIRAVRYVDENGRFDPVALEELNHFFRCRYDDKVYPIDPGLFYWLDIVKTQMGFPGARYRLYSGYRSPEYNRRLRKRGFRAAGRSFHLQGRAADIRLEGVGLDALRRKVSELQFGGVSRYRSFVHVDVGPFRTW